MFILDETATSNLPAIWSAIAAISSFIVAFITLCITIKKNLNERKRK
ncbi:putative holin-like toxin [Staphylococcus haemolyticus]|nr:putative holin-like toxin [Staphylococcus haemolyticus]